MPRSFQVVCLLFLSSFIAYAQAQAPAVVTFTVDFPASEPAHYSIRVQSDGACRYQSGSRLSADSIETDSHDNDSRGNDFHGNDSRGDDSHDNDSFDLDFTLSAETRQKIFGLAAKAGYFQKDVDSHRKGMAFTGKKTLSYKDAQRSGESTYNYSAISAVQDITSLLQGLAATLEFGHRLEYDRHYQKLALDEELKRMEEMAHSNQLIEITAVQPILDQIIADQSVINVTRARAQRLLERAGGH